MTSPRSAYSPKPVLNSEYRIQQRLSRRMRAVRQVSFLRSDACLPVSSATECQDRSFEIARLEVHNKSPLKVLRDKTSQGSPNKFIENFSIIRAVGAAAEHSPNRRSRGSTQAEGPRRKPTSVTQFESPTRLHKLRGGLLHTHGIGVLVARQASVSANRCSAAIPFTDGMMVNQVVGCEAVSLSTDRNEIAETSIQDYPSAAHQLGPNYSTSSVLAAPPMGLAPAVTQDLFDKDPPPDKFTS